MIEASFERWAKAPILRHHGCMEDARLVPQDPDGPVTVDGDGRLVLYGDRGGDAPALPGRTFLVYAGPDRELRRGRQRVRNKGKIEMGHRCCWACAAASVWIPSEG